MVCYFGVIVMDSDNIYGEQFCFKLFFGKIEFYFVILEELFSGYGVLCVCDFVLKKENEFYFIQGKVVVYINGVMQYVFLFSELMWDNVVWVYL